MAKSITSANAVVMLSITGIFDTPQQLQEFSAEDIFDVDEIQMTLAEMGVDGFLAAGFVNEPVSQRFSFLASAAACVMFDTWYANNKIQQDCFFANATVQLPSIGQKWSCTGGTLLRGKPLPTAAKTLRPRSWTILWEKVLPQNI